MKIDKSYSCTEAHKKNLDYNKENTENIWSIISCIHSIRTGKTKRMVICTYTSDMYEKENKEAGILVTSGGGMGLWLRKGI